MSEQRDNQMLKDLETVDTPTDASDNNKNTGKFFIYFLEVDPN